MKFNTSFRSATAWLLVTTGIVAAGFSFAQQRMNAGPRAPAQAPIELVDALSRHAAPGLAQLEGGGWVELSEDGTALVMRDPSGLELSRNGLHPRRRNASVSLLPSGRVLVWGGLDGQHRLVEGGIWFDPSTSRAVPASEVGLLPRAGHSMTVLPDGRALVLGGWSGDLGSVPEPEFWDERSGRATLGEGLLEPPRHGHLAEIHSLAGVGVDGGVDAAGRHIDSVSSFRFEPALPAPMIADQASTPGILGSLPGNGAEDVPVDALISLLFDEPVDLVGFDPGLVSLLGPTGPTPARVATAEAGRLVFVEPVQDLFPGTGYTLLVDGLVSRSGQPLPLVSIQFQTRSLDLPEDGRQASTSGVGSTAGRMTGSTDGAAPSGQGRQRDPSEGSQSSPTGHSDQAPAGRLELVAGAGFESTADADRAFDCEFRSLRPRLAPCRARAALLDGKWLPGEDNTDGRWRVYGQRPAQLSASRLAPMVERLGITVVTGEVLRVDGRPVAGVEVGIGPLTTRTDTNGRFVLTGVEAGRREIHVDGATAGRRARGLRYGEFVAGIDVEKGVLNELPYQMFIPQIADRDRIRIPSPLRQDAVLTHPDMPGLEVHVPAGTVFRDRRGRILNEIALVPTPVNRAPVPVPENFPMYFTVEPGGAVIQGLTPEAARGIRIHYPNYDGYTTEDHAEFYIYDTAAGWQVYGRGYLNPAGTHFVPEDGVALHRMVGGSYGVPTNDPATEDDMPPDGDCCEGGAGGGGTAQVGDPIDLFTGQFFYKQTDIVITDIVPIQVGRHYRPRDTRKREFGIGTAGGFAYRLHNPGNSYATVDLVLPNGSRLEFVRVSGSGFSGTWRHTASRTAFAGAQMRTINDSAGYGYRVTLRDGSQLHFSNFGGRLQWMRDRFGNRTTYAYEAGLVSRITSPSGRFVEFDYDTQNRVQAARDHIGRQVTYGYNEAGLLDTVTYPDQTTERYEYAAFSVVPGQAPVHRMTAVIDRRGNRLLENTYNDALLAVGQRQADGTEYSIEYVPRADGGPGHDVATVTQPDGTVRRVEFDASGYPAVDTWAYGTPLARSFTYEREASTGRILAQIDALGRRTEYQYNDLGQATRVTYLAGSPEAQSIDFEYGAQGDLLSLTDSIGRVTRMDYADGCLVAITDPLGQRTETVCNGAGQPVRTTDPLGQTVHFDYVGFDLARVTDPLGRESSYRYDALGRLIAAEDALGNLHRREYDLSDRISRAIDPRGQETRLEYDGNGNVVRVILPGGGQVAFSYDERDRLVYRTDGLLQEERWTYDEMDRVVGHLDRRQNLTTFEYDVLGRAVRTTDADGRTLLAVHDAGDRLLSLTDSVSGPISWTYDGFDRVLSEESAQGLVSYLYDATGRRIQMTAAGQAPVHYAYDDADQLVALTQGDEQVQFAHDLLGRRSRVTLPNGVSMSYRYDEAGQLLGIDYEGIGGAELGDIAFGYDAAGRRTAQTGSWASQALPAASSQPSTFDANNRLLSFDGAAIEYDANGNLTTKGSRSFVWDARDQLVAILDSGQTIATFSYDALGRRIQRVEHGVTTGYLYDGIDPVQEVRNGDLVPILTGLNVDERYARGSGANRHYFLTDALGSSIALTDGQGAVRQRYHYTPYGQTSSSGVEDYANPYQYTGRERDASGLYFYRARYYSPQMARFLSEDPSGFAGGLNLYGYVHQDPLSLVDPDGNVPIAPLVWGGAKMYARCTAACSAQSAIIDRLTGGARRYRISARTARFRV